jgi:hypothetical protein
VRLKRETMISRMRLSKFKAARYSSNRAMS